jgi:hypothetical protein
MMEELASPESEVTSAPADAPEAVDTSFDSSLLEPDAPPEVETSDDDSEEVDYEGEKYKLPKKLKDALLRQQDYTQKTQQVAEQRRAIEAQAQQVQQHAEMSQRYVAEYAEAFALDKELQRYKEINFDQLTDSDPVTALKLDRQMRDLQARRDQVVATVTQKQQAQSIEQQRINAQRLNEGRAVLEREIKGWSPDTAKALVSFGQELGYTEQELTQVNDPRTVKLLHKAWQYDQLTKAKTAKPAPVTQERPVTRITASKATVKTPATMTDNEFAQWRRSQIKNRN